MTTNRMSRWIVASGASAGVLLMASAALAFRLASPIAQLPSSGGSAFCQAVNVSASAIATVTVSIFQTDSSTPLAEAEGAISSGEEINATSAPSEFDLYTYCRVTVSGANRKSIRASIKTFHGDGTRVDTFALE